MNAKELLESQRAGMSDQCQRILDSDVYKTGGVLDTVNAAKIIGCTQSQGGRVLLNLFNNMKLDKYGDGESGKRAWYSRKPAAPFLWRNQSNEQLGFIATSGIAPTVEVSRCHSVII